MGRASRDEGLVARVAHPVLDAPCVPAWAERCCEVAAANHARPSQQRASVALCQTPWSPRTRGFADRSGRATPLRQATPRSGRANTRPAVALLIAWQMMISDSHQEGGQCVCGIARPSARLPDHAYAAVLLRRHGERHAVVVQIRAALNRCEARRRRVHARLSRARDRSISNLATYLQLEVLRQAPLSQWTRAGVGRMRAHSLFHVEGVIP